MNILDLVEVDAEVVELFEEANMVHSSYGHPHETYDLALAPDGSVVCVATSYRPEDKYDC